MDYYILFHCTQCADFETNSLTTVQAHIIETMVSEDGAHDVYPTIEREVLE